MENYSGTSVKGYQLGERIGVGGFGVVYKSYQSTLGREVAIKVVLPGYVKHPEFIRRFETEAHLIARLEHLHIVPLYDYWRDPEGAYLVMRLMRGGSLQDELREGSLRSRDSCTTIGPSDLGIGSGAQKQNHSPRHQTV